MQCPQCNAEANSEAVFCIRCGSQLQVRCRHCGAVSPSESQYCGACGTSISVASTAEEVPPVPPTAAEMACPRCSSTSEPGSEFCFNCGLPLDEPGSVDAVRDHASGVPGERGGFWLRLVAFIVDSIIATSIAFALLAPFVDGVFSQTWDEEFGVADVVDIVVDVAYFGTLVAIWQATLGKRLFGLYVVRSNGSRVGFGRAVARYFAYYLSGIILLIGFIMIGVRKDKRGLHDLICDTVVRKR